MEILIKIFGEGKSLDCLQMTLRGVVIFFIALILIRISGRRSFGIRSPFDNIIMILLGAVLSRAVVGASAFLPTIIVCLAIVCLHRITSYLSIKYQHFGNLVEGKKILLFKNGRFIESNLSRALVGKDDIMEGVRKTALTENMDDIECVYMERNGEISAVKKDKG